MLIVCRSSLNSVAQIISQNLASVSSHLTKNADVLSSIAVYPLSNYPGRDQGALLSQLLRKKLEPYVEDWVEEGRAVGADLKDREEFTELWEWAMMAANEEARKHEWDGAEYTLEEKERGVEHVVTGLKKGIYEEDSSEDEDDDGKEEEGKGAATAKLAKEQATVQRPMAIDELLRFLVKGEAALK